MRMFKVTETNTLNSIRVMEVILSEQVASPSVKENFVKLIQFWLIFFYNRLPEQWIIVFRLCVERVKSMSIAFLLSC